MEWNGMEGNGMEWNGMEWNGVLMACCTHGWPGEVKGIFLNSWESVSNPSEFSLRCEDVGAL